MEYRTATYNSLQAVVEMVSVEVSVIEVVWLFYIIIEDFKETNVRFDYIYVHSRSLRTLFPPKTFCERVVRTEIAT